MRSEALPRVAASIVVVAGLVVSVISGLGPSAPGREDAAPTPRPVADSITRLSFRLPDLDGRAYTPNARNIALRSSAHGPLLLFLPATGAVPRDYGSFLSTAEAQGYHVLALDYWNVGISVARTCSTDASCYGAVQANRFDGSHPGTFSAIPPADSILSRLRHALTVLRGRDPAGGWDRYLTDGQVRWSRIVVAGHSQGGGESAFIAHLHRVRGVLMFASPVATDGTVSASWMSQNGATPMSRYYGFDDRHDVYFDRILGSWAVLGVGGTQPPVQLGAAPSAISGSHRIISDLELGTPGQAHSRVVADDGPRTDTGRPVFAPIWRWMLTAVLRSMGSIHTGQGVVS